MMMELRSQWRGLRIKLNNYALLVESRYVLCTLHIINYTKKVNIVCSNRTERDMVSVSGEARYQVGCDSDQAW